MEKYFNEATELARQLYNFGYATLQEPQLRETTPGYYGTPMPQQLKDMAERMTDIANKINEVTIAAIKEVEEKEKESVEV